MPMSGGRPETWEAYFERIEQMLAERTGRTLQDWIDDRLDELAMHQRFYERNLEITLEITHDQAEIARCQEHLKKIQVFTDLLDGYLNGTTDERAVRGAYMLSLRAYPNME